MFAHFDVTPRFLLTVLLAFNKLQPSKTQGCPFLPCQYGGTCVNNVCSCPPGLTGPTCSNVYCSNYPCFNGGTCVPGPPDVCICQTGSPVQPFCAFGCQNHPCVNGTCVGDVCNCDANFAGPQCESAIAAYLSPWAITVTEGDVGQKAVTVQVCRQPSSEEVTLSVYTSYSGSDPALPDVDYVNIPFNTPQDVTISAGQPCTPVNVFIISDLTQEKISKNFNLFLRDPQPSSSMVYFVDHDHLTLFKIIDDDPGCLMEPCQNGGTCNDDVCSCSQEFLGPSCQTSEVYLSPLEVSVIEGNVSDDTSVQIRVCRKPSYLTMTVSVTTSQDSAMTSSDFTPISLDVTIPSGQRCVPVDISIVSDMIIEPTEVFHLVILPFPSVYIRFGEGTATVTIIDNDDTDPPVITNCPFDSSRSIAPGTSTSVFWAPPTASDNSGDVTLTSSHQPGDTFSLGQTTVTYTATDGAGNTEQCQFVITVMIVPNSPPQIGSCPTDFTTFPSGNQFFLQFTTPSCTDPNGDAVTVTCNPAAGSNIANFPGVITCTCTDLSQATDSVACPVNQPPTVQCPTDFSVTAPPLSTSTTAQFNTPQCVDNQQANFLATCTPSSGSLFIAGPGTVVCTCTDSGGLTDSCTFIVTVQSVNSPPQIGPCPTDIKTVPSGNQFFLQFTTPSCTDPNGDTVTVTCIPAAGSIIANLPGVITCTCTDSFQATDSVACPELPSISEPPTQLTRTTTSVTITWRPWDEETDVGDPPVVAYIPYYKMDPSQDWMSGSRIQADQTLEYTASSLESDRNYTFSVAAVREGEGGEGPRGPPVTIKTLCIDVVPLMVRTTLTATNDVTVIWQQPTVQCSTGITKFTIYYEVEGDVSSRQEAGRADPNAESFTIDGSLLEPETTYNIAVTVTTDQESALSEGSPVTTAESEPPSSPVYLAALVIPVLIIIILLVVIIKRIRRKPATGSKPEDVQDVDYVNAGVAADPEDNIALEERSRNTPAQKYQDLTEKEAPTQVSGYERTIHETADAAPKAMPRQGIKRHTDYQYEDVNCRETDARKLPSVPQPDLQSEDETEYEVPEMFEEYTGVYINSLRASKPITPRPMKITEYKTFMGRERSKVIRETVQQFTALQTGQQHPWTAAIKLQNKPKNFFKALLPYDHSRVRLDTDGSDVRSDYINASYIKNHQGKVSFIAAQGPREGTKDDFWRMVWKEDVETIVTLVDKDGTEQHSKDAQYWPNKVNTSQKYGAITVLLMETTAFRSYILREMNVIKGNEKFHTTVTQYEIPCWKYGGVPSEPADLTSAIKQIKNHQKGGKHLLVHCSNGVGATGVFISLYDLMDVIKTKKEVSVFDVIEGMRKDRVNMVLTKLQYLFIFDALLEAMLSPDSQMSCDQLKKLDLSAMKKKCKKEFQILQETTKHQEDLATLAGNSSENNHKNRFPDLLPVDKFRPVLKSPGNLFGSNGYINATFAKNISQRGFIMTQSPLASTVEDVWRLVFDYDCKCIVMLNTVDDSDESLSVYWPNVHNAAASNGLMTVICKKIEESDVFTRRQFEVKHKRSQKALLVDHFSFHGWLGNKPDVHKLREFIKYTRIKGAGPALVHCINGVGLSAVYVTVISELERLDKEGTVDVFQTLNKLRKQCPKAVQTQDEYLLCYELLRDHLNNPEEYAVVF
ncbi:uncharacterized protein [Apostichopus japonicus]|uniref:uncharacterized protein isoform X2 n=1 Tax=Stichopus japonicus TaxID=307972 RepID=UPI003AB6D8E0